MSLIFANNAASTLAATITLVSSTLVVQIGEGVRFPAPGVGESFLFTVQNGSAYEIMECTSRSGDIFTVLRGRDGTSAQTWGIGSSVDMRVSKGVLESFAQGDKAFQKTGDEMSGPLLFDDSVSTSSPPAAFVGDPNTGISHPAPDTLGMVTGGTERIRLTTADFTLTVPTYAPGGSAGAPGYAFASDPDTGVYSAAVNTVGIATGGAPRLTVSNTNVSILTDLTLSANFAVAGAVDINASLDVGTTLIVGGAAAFGNGISVTGAMNSTGSATVGTTLTVGSTATFSSNATVVGTLTVNGLGDFKGGLAVAAAATVGTTLQVGIPGTSGNLAVVASQFPATLGPTGTSRELMGKVEKWGAGIVSGGAVTITFPVAFTNGIYTVYLQPIGSFGDPVLIPKLSVHSVTPSGFQVQGPSDTSYDFYWHAIGRDNI